MSEKSWLNMSYRERAESERALRDKRIAAEPERQLVYGEVDRNLVFLPEQRAIELRALHVALQTSTTWGELSATLTADYMSEILDAVTEQGEEPAPAPNDPFEAADIPGFEDGDWPAWPAQEMLDWMPSEVVKRFGGEEDSVLNGSFLHLDPSREDEITLALTASGFATRRDDSLVIAASGHGAG